MDDLARKTLEYLEGQRIVGYSNFFSVWTRNFEERRPVIQSAQERLLSSDLAKRIVSWGINTENDVRSDVLSDWFANRIFDQWLVKQSDGTNKVDAAVYLPKPEDAAGQRGRSV